MDKLKSEQDKLCMWLSDDPDYILDQCGDILSRNEFRLVEKQSSALEKMRVLLKIITEKGKDTCQSFIDILRQHQEHYKQLQQLFSPKAQGKGSAAPTVVADSGSVVTTREITNTKAKSLNMRIETVSGHGCSSSGNVGGQVRQADYSASDGGVICADKISGVAIDGDINFSVSVNTPQVRAGTVAEALPSSQGPAVKMITTHKVELIDCLRADCSFILQHIHARQIVTDRQYQELKETPSSEKTVTDLIDQVIGNGQESCSLFTEVLKQPEVLSTYPQLKDITRNWS